MIPIDDIATAVQPAPTPGSARVPNNSAFDEVYDDLAKRAEFGKAKYGGYLTVDNGRDFGVDAYQEALDLQMYAEGRYAETGEPVWENIASTADRLAFMIREQLILERK